MNRNELNRLLLGGVLCGALLTAGKIHAEEEASPVLTAVSSTTISGYVDTSALFSSYGGADYFFAPGNFLNSTVQMGIGINPGSFAGATTPPNTVETTLYFSPPQHSSSGSVAMAPFEIGSDGPYLMPIELSGTFGSFDYSGAGKAFDPSTSFPSPSTPVEPSTTIPEPSTVALFVGGLSLLALRRRKSQN